MGIYWTARFYAWRTLIDAAALAQRGAARIEKRARRAVGGGHRPHPMVKCGACDAVLYDDHSGAVYERGRYARAVSPAPPPASVGAGGDE
jgi:hypothetical protein